MNRGGDSTWGDSSDPSTIRIGGFATQVTRNLDAALRAIQKFMTAKRGITEIRLWVDAICINQSDVQERSQQVQNMRQIYVKATEVIAWVGTAEKEYECKKTAARLAATRALDRSTNPGLISGSDMATVYEFFSQDYWKRVWIIQEITVPDKVTILFGNYDFPWDHVAELVSVVKKIGTSRETAVLRSTPEHLLEFRRFSAEHKPIDLFEALIWSRRCRATNLRDKIFALLGLCHDWRDFVPVPNYNQSLGSILADMNKAMMNRDKSLDIMCLKATSVCSGHSVGVPTWSTDWPRLWIGGTTLLEDRLLVSQSTGSFNPILPGSTDTVLNVRGRVLGSITGLTSAIQPFEKFFSPPKNPDSWILETENLSATDPSLGKAGSYMIRFRDLLWETLTMSLLFTPVTHAHTQMWTSFRWLWRPEGRGLITDLDLLEWVDRNAWFQVGSYTLREWSQMTEAKAPKSHSLKMPNILSSATPKTEHSDQLDKQAMVSFINTLGKVLRSGMKLACLDNGAIAMVHYETKRDDRIYRLEGCSVPVILRRKGTARKNKHRFTVIGAAYVDESQKFESSEERAEELSLF